MIFLTGHHGSGKSTLAKRFSVRGFIHIETGNIVRNKYKEIGSGQDFHDWATSVSHGNPNYFNDCVLEKIVQAHNEITESDGEYIGIIVDGNRQISGIEYIKHNAPSADLHSDTVVYLDATYDELYRRQLARPDKKIPDVSFDSFVAKYLAFDNEMGLEQIKAYADEVIDSCIGPDNVEYRLCEIAVSQGYQTEQKLEIRELGGYQYGELRR